MLPAVKDYRALAGRRLARFAFDYLDGGAEDGRTLARNQAAFETLLFRPRALQDVAEVDAGVELFGRRHAMPALVGPTGLNGLYWPRAEEALAKAARDALPGWADEDAEVRVAGGRVTVRLRPPSLSAGLAEHLVVTGSAMARPR